MPPLVGQTARDLGISETFLRNWMHRDAIDSGVSCLISIALSLATVFTDGLDAGLPALAQATIVDIAVIAAVCGSFFFALREPLRRAKQLERDHPRALVLTGRRGENLDGWLIRVDGDRGLGRLDFYVTMVVDESGIQLFDGDAASPRRRLMMPPKQLPKVSLGRQLGQSAIKVSSSLDPEDWAVAIVSRRLHGIVMQSRAHTVAQIREADRQLRTRLATNGGGP